MEKISIWSMKHFEDDYENKALIEKSEGFPYKGATEKVEQFTLSLYATYDNNKMYFLSVYETEEDAMEKLKDFSCGTFKRNIS